MEKINLDKRNLKNFGITMFIAFIVITGFIFIKHKYSIVFTLAIAIVFIVLALLRPTLLKSVYISWMRLAFVLAWINTQVILIVMFYLIFTPIGFIMRIFKADLLERKIEKNKLSYWKQKEKAVFNPLNYEKQF